MKQKLKTTWVFLLSLVLLVTQVPMTVIAASSADQAEVIVSEEAGDAEILSDDFDSTNYVNEEENTVVDVETPDTIEQVGNSEEADIVTNSSKAAKSSAITLPGGG